ncbi:hypothetical protein [Streptomyces silvisoli]|uniref:WXG100 family type VII secretion target n=1 Tax=Streptomyces silvisoli TaxID=3034235 RepID=A0ABT5ZQW1_9ACTN|nr:hypothetical protein [Streptomyces silvisoli]MDF3292041.1 hypothetical protein [Streptomyces silvisoli]
MVAPSNDAKVLAVKAESLAVFKGRVDKMLSDLEKSQASHTNVGTQGISHSSYGEGFAEASDLAGLYDKVHSRLVALSQAFGDQIEALGIAVQMAKDGYSGVDQEQMERLIAIQQSTEQLYQNPKSSASGAQSPASSTHQSTEGQGKTAAPGSI